MKRRKPAFLILGMLLFALLLCPAASAETPSGYIFRIRQDISLFSETALPNGTEAVYRPEGLYKTDDLSLIRELEDAGLLVSYEPDDIIYLDSIAQQEAALDTLPWHTALVGTAYAEASGITGQGVRVAVIDSGFSDPNHEFSSATIETGINFLAAEGTEERSNTTDTYGHGTNVARMIASEEVGVAPKVTLIPLKAFDANDGYISDIVSAIYEAVNTYECDILNLSLGTLVENETMKTAISHALDQGVLVISAAGNLGTSEVGMETNLYRFPAAQEGVIAVGSVNASKAVHEKSVRNDSVFVTAPGAEIDYIDPSTGIHSTKSGTSFAAPIVSGAAALALSIEPDLTADAFSGLLIRTSEDLGKSGYDTSYGHGIVNIGLLLTTLQEKPQQLTLSERENELLGSVWLEAPVETSYSICLAAYAVNGKFLGASWKEMCSGDQMLCGLPLPRGTLNYKLFYLREADYIPVAGAYSSE